MLHCLTQASHTYPSTHCHFEQGTWLISQSSTGVAKNWTKDISQGIHLETKTGVYPGMGGKPTGPLLWVQLSKPGKKQ